MLFLCTGNGARSQMAEALAQRRSGGLVRAFSAGSHPRSLHPNTVQVMAERGIDVRGRAAKHLSAFTADRFAYVITLCDRVREVCPEFPGHPRHIHWSIPDPATAGDTDEASYPAFQATAAELDARIGFLLVAIAATRPFGPPGGAMTSPHDIVNVRYMVDDVQAAVDFELFQPAASRA